MDMWRSGTFPKQLQVSVIPITNTYRGTSERSTSDSLGDIGFRKLLYSYRGRMCHSSPRPPKHLGMSLHVISFTRHSPVLVLQTTNAGEGRPGYEATTMRYTRHRECCLVLPLPSAWTGTMHPTMFVYSTYSSDNVIILLLNILLNDCRINVFCHECKSSIYRMLNYNLKMWG